VLLDTMVVNAEPVAEPAGLIGNPWQDLRARVRALRQQARGRLRARTSRMGIDPGTADHVVDAVDQQIETTAARVEQLISAAEETSEPLPVEAQAAIVEKLQGATEQMEQAVERIDTIAAPSEDALRTSGLTGELAPADSSEATTRSERAVEQIATAITTPAETRDHVSEPVSDASVDNLDQATQRFEEAVQNVETLVVAAQDESREAHAAEVRHRPHSRVGPQAQPEK